VKRNHRVSRLSVSAAKPTTTMTAAERTRMESSDIISLSILEHLAEAALAGVIGVDGLEQLVLAEVGPQRGRDVQLGVCHLPEQEVGDAQVPAGADEQLGVGDVGHVEELREGSFIQG